MKRFPPSAQFLKCMSGFRARLIQWLTGFAFILAAWIINVGPLIGISCFVLLNFIAAIFVLKVRRVRLFLLSKPLYEHFGKMLPPISRTEREALEAGTVWWDGEFLSGRPDWKKLLAQPEPLLTPEEEAFLSGPVEELCGMLDDWRITEEYRDFPPDVWQFIREKGFLGLIIPKTYGGLEFSPLAHSQVVMKLAGRSCAAAVTVMVPGSPGLAELLLHYGTKDQKGYYLPRMASGEEIPCFALTGPEAESDAASIPDKGIVCWDRFDGEEVLGLRLNWEKRYIALGPVATLIGLAFRLFDPEHLLGDRDEPGITVALIPASLPGIIIGGNHDPLGVPFQNGSNLGKDVFIPLGMVVGGKEGIGQGWRMLTECLAPGRSISLPAFSTGQAKMIARSVGAYARIRRQFHLPIGRFERIGKVLARIAGNTYLMDALRIMTCGAVDRGERPSVVSAIFKHQSTERLRNVVNDGMDIMGGSGISRGPRNLIARFYQGAPIGINVEGAYILTRSMIISGQVLIRCHPFIQKEMRAVADTDAAEGVAEFDRLLEGHLGFVLGNMLRSLFHGLTGARFVKTPGGPGRPYFQAAARLSAAFALTAEVALLTLGGSLKRCKRLSWRLADILGHFYLIFALLKRFEERGRPADEVVFVEWGCEECLERIQKSLAKLAANLPYRPAAWLLRFCVFPLGRPFAGPDDDIVRRLADILLEASSLRDRLTAGI